MSNPREKNRTSKISQDTTKSTKVQFPRLGNSGQVGTTSTADYLASTIRVRGEIVRGQITTTIKKNGRRHDKNNCYAEILNLGRQIGRDNSPGLVPNNNPPKSNRIVARQNQRSIRSKIKQHHEKFVVDCQEVWNKSRDEENVATKIEHCQFDKLEDSSKPPN